MREESTIRNMLDKMLFGKYHQYQRNEIGTLFWVLGITSTIRAGVKKAIELEGEQQPSKDRENAS